MGLTKIEDGRPDRCEIYSLPIDDLLALEPHSNPPTFENHRSTLASCAKHMKSVANVILTQLARHLSLPPDTFSSMHAPTKPSSSTLRFLHMPPQQASAAQTALMGHTDNGTVTVLFNIVGGLQVLDETKSWRYVRPQPGHAIVNIGDSMVQWTGGILRSKWHRVVPPPGMQSEVSRFSMAYVLKPPHACRMERLKGGIIPSSEGEEEEEEDVGVYKEFHAKKFKGYEEGKNLAGDGGGKKLEKGVNVKVNEVVV